MEISRNNNPKHKNTVRTLHGLVWEGIYMCWKDPEHQKNLKNLRLAPSAPQSGRVESQSAQKAEAWLISTVQKTLRILPIQFVSESANLQRPAIGSLPAERILHATHRRPLMNLIKIYLSRKFKQSNDEHGITFVWWSLLKNESAERLRDVQLSQALFTASTSNCIMLPMAKNTARCATKSGSIYGLC